MGLYAGIRYTPDQAEALGLGEGPATYLFRLSDGVVIDGSSDGNELRYLNHSCEPNCEALEFEDERSELQIEICTTRRIQPGKELLLDYRLDANDTDAHRCDCRMPTCRGTMVANSTF